MIALLTLAGYAAMECYGVVGMAEIDEAAGVALVFLPTYRLRKGIDVTSTPKGVQATFHIVVEQGVNMASVVDNLESSVKFLLKQIAELSCVDVTVHIEAMRNFR